MAEHEVDGVLADALVPLQQLLQVNRIGAVLVGIRRSARRRSYIAIVGAAGWSWAAAKDICLGSSLASGVIGCNSMSVPI